MSTETLTETQESILMELFYTVGVSAFLHYKKRLGITRVNESEGKVFRCFWGAENVHPKTLRSLIQHGWITKFDPPVSMVANHRLSDKAVAFCCERVSPAQRDASLEASAARYEQARADALKVRGWRERQ
jgi:hypothetical protein